jgi:hypothetical protein
MTVIRMRGVGRLGSSSVLMTGLVRRLDLVTATSVHLTSGSDPIWSRLTGAEAGLDQDADDVLFVAADVSRPVPSTASCLLTDSSKML